MISKAQGYDRVGVEIRDLIKVYRTKAKDIIALRGIDASIPAGRAVGIVGPSGCGKTTLLNLIGGLDRCTAGSIRVGEREITRRGEKELAKYRRETVGIVFQFFNLVPLLTAQENVELPLRMVGWKAPEREKKAMDLLEIVGLQSRADHRPDALSAGEQQRVALAVALANDPPMLLADEPTGELDSVNAEAVMGLLQDLVHENGKTAVIVSHDPRIGEYVNQVIRMTDGRLVGSGP